MTATMAATILPIWYVISSYPIPVGDGTLKKNRVHKKYIIIDKTTVIMIFSTIFFMSIPLLFHSWIAVTIPSSK